MTPKFRATHIEWDTDGEEVEGLPTETVIEAEDEDCVADALSDKFGWCVFAVECEEVSDA